MSSNGQRDDSERNADLGPLPEQPEIPDFGRGRNAVRPGRPKRQIAVALGFNPGEDAAPKVMASGQGNFAERLLELAFANDVKVREDADLAEILAAVEVGSIIPLEAFSAVAEIIAYLYQANSGNIDPWGDGVGHPRGVSRAVVREDVAAAAQSGYTAPRAPRGDPFQPAGFYDDFSNASTDEAEWVELPPDDDATKGTEI